ALRWASVPGVVPRAAPALAPGARSLPLAVWAGLALLAAGLPVGALVRVRRRRQERRLAWRMSLR
ncbi:MAG: hypothetical protein M3370_08255, partial [Actinomycetota bacterium]|nr:hypothetical protein [Actinomycetota bacterium]